MMGLKKNTGVDDFNDRIEELKNRKRNRRLLDNGNHILAMNRIMKKMTKE